jgi:hypothetical protein
MLEDYMGASLRTLAPRRDGETDKAWEKRQKRAMKMRLPPKAVLIRYIRIAYLNFSYWINDYRPGGPEMLDPLELYQGFPYYGFMIDPKDEQKKRIILSPVCSPAKPVPEFYVPHTGKHKKQRQQQLEEEEDDDDEQEREMEARLKKRLEKENRKREREAEEDGTSITIPARFKQPAAKVIKTEAV